jgi:hypothetical protein
MPEQTDAKPVCPAEIRVATETWLVLPEQFHESRRIPRNWQALPHALGLCHSVPQIETKTDCHLTVVGGSRQSLLKSIDGRRIVLLHLQRMDLM